MARRRPAAFLAALPLLLAVDTCGGTDILGDPGFDLWCGESLCAWVVEEGEVRAVATWHQGDLGAELVGDRVVLAQLSDITQRDVECIAFDLTSDVDDGVAIQLEIDFLDDGTAEYSHVVTSDDYQAVSYAITPPEWFHDAAFRLVKEGSGAAVVAQIRARAVAADQCPGEPLELLDRPAGGECTEAEQCLDGACAEIESPGGLFGTSTEEVCVECSTDEACDDGQICGLAWGEEALAYGLCQDPDPKELGEPCLSGSECISGACRGAVCSDCETDEDCGEGGDCAPDPAYADAYPGLEPDRCVNLLGTLASGAACTADTDCASGSCSDAEPVRMCAPTGRPCETDDDCDIADPLAFWGDANCAETVPLGATCD